MGIGRGENTSRLEPGTNIRKVCKDGISISHERIYQYIHADKRVGGTLWTHLHGHLKYSSVINLLHLQVESKGQLLLMVIEN